MAFSQASIKYKPLRVGFLVREGNVEDLVAAAGINSLLWGGMYNPLLPISTGTNEFAAQLIHLFAIDILVATAEQPELGVFLERYPYLRDPSHSAEKLFIKDWRTSKKLLGLLDVRNLVELLWREEYKNSPEEYQSNFAVVEWVADDALADVFALQFGYYSDKFNLKWNYEKIFLNGLRANTLKLSAEENIGVDSRNVIAPIMATGVRLQGYSHAATFEREGLYIWRLKGLLRFITFLEYSSRR